MFDDPIVAEIHAIRQQLLEEANGDLSLIVKRGADITRERGLEVVNREPKRPGPEFDWLRKPPAA